MKRKRGRIKNDVENDSDGGEGCIQKSARAIQRGVHYMKIYDCEDKQYRGRRAVTSLGCVDDGFGA
jgi:hypothetical protein